MRYRSVGVVGAGVIGCGVAQNLAQTGHGVVLVDVSGEALQRARTEIAKGLRFAQMFDSALRRTDASAVLERIELTTDDGRLAGVDVVVENVTESWDVKQAVYPRLDRVCHTECVLAANTSTISITRLGRITNRPDRVIGVHFMNPVPQKPVVEVIRGHDTSPATVEAAREFLQQMGKSAIVVNDMPGFVSNRVLMLAINEAIAVVQDGVAAPRDVDDIFVKCFAHKMGPLATADLIGLDTVLRSLEMLCESYHEVRFRPCPLLREMVARGRLGRKAGGGFFEYAEPRSR